MKPLSKTQHQIMTTCAMIRDREIPLDGYAYNVDTKHIGIPCQSPTMRKQVMELVETGNLELHKWDSQLSKDDEVELWVRIPVLPGEEDTYEELDEMTRKQTGEKPDREAGPNPYCLCGCGERTQTKKAAFVPGHDAKFSGRLKRIARGKYTDEDVETTLGNDEAMDHAKIQKSNYMQENIAAAREALPKWESERKKDPEQNVLKNGIPGKKRGKAA